MNAAAAALGCTGSHFTTPHGLDGYGGYSTAHDLLLVLLADLRFATFRAIVDTRTYTVPATAHNYLHSLTNVHEPSVVVSGRGGSETRQYDGGRVLRCALCRARRPAYRRRDPGHADRFTDVRDLMNFALHDFTWHSPTGVSASLESLLYPADDFRQDIPRPLSGRHRKGRASRGATTLGPGISCARRFWYDFQHPGIGLPTSQATTLGSCRCSGSAGPSCSTIRRPALWRPAPACQRHEEVSHDRLALAETGFEFPSRRSSWMPVQWRPTCRAVGDPFEGYAGSTAWCRRSRCSLLPCAALPTCWPTFPECCTSRSSLSPTGPS